MKRLFTLMVLCVCLLSFTGIVIAEVNYNKTGYPICDEMITVKAAGAFGLEVDYEEILTWKEWQDRLGIKLEMNFYNYEDWPTQLTLMLASEELPDIVFSSGLTDVQVADYGSQGYFVNFLDYPDLIPNIMKAWENHPGLQGATTSYNGAMYGTKSIITSTVNKIARTFINKTWLENVDMQVPVTLDELYDVLVAFKTKDANGNGDPDDEIPMGFYTSATGDTEKPLLVAHGINSNTTTYMLQANGDKVYLADTTDNYRAYLRFMNKCYAEGLMDTQAFTLTDSEVMLNCKNDKYGFYGTGAAPFVMAGPIDISYDANWLGLMGLTSEYNETPTLGIPSGILTTYQMLISADSEYVEPLIRFVDYLFGEEGGTSTFSGYEGVTFDYELDPLLGIDVLTIYCPEGYGSADEFRQYKAVFNGPFLTYSGIPVRNAIWYDTPLEKLQNEDVINKYGWIAQLAAASRREGLQHVPTFPYESMSYTADEINEVATLKTDITTYLQQAKANFIIGEWSLDTDWQKHLDQLEAMGLTRLMAIEQASWMRFLGK